MSQLAELDRLVETLTGAHRAQMARFDGQVAFARKLSELHPDEKVSWEAILEDAVRCVHAALESEGLEGLASAIEKAEQILSPIGEKAKQYTIYCVGHGHIDMNWMWSWPETVSVTNDTFTTVDRLMEEYPDFCYTQSQASVYALVEKYHPELFERIRQRVAEGRWEIAASMWVEGDKNVVSGESLCRHLLYTRSFMKERFGLDPEDIPIDWEPDTFGHAHTIPSFLTRAGVRRYYLCRSGEDKRPPVFWWRAPDGSRVLVCKETTWYNATISPEIGSNLVDFAKETGLKDWMCVYGVGDHGGGPTRRDLDQARELDGWPVFPQVRLATTRRFYEILEAQGERWPVLDQELNFVFPGCYTSQSNIKRANRFAETFLVEAEAAASVAWALGVRDYPTDAMREGWIHTLFCQFHDILPGSGVRATYDYAQGLFQETAARTGMAQTQSLRAIAAQVDTRALLPENASGACEPVDLAIGAGVGEGSGLDAFSSYHGGSGAYRPFLIFNPNAWTQSEVVTATLWDMQADPAHIVVRDDCGKCFPAQLIEQGDFWGHRFVRVVFSAEQIPALGYRTYMLYEGEVEPLSEGVRKGGSHVLENGLIQVSFDPLTGGIAHLIDRRTGVDLAVEGNPMASLEYAVERPHGMTAWVIGDLAQSTCPLSAATSNWGEVGPYHGTVKNTYKINNSLVTVDTTIKEGDPRVEIVIKTVWLERGTPETGVPMLRFHCPLALEDLTTRYETPYGHIVRDLYDGQEVPSQRFADVTGKSPAGATAGLTLLNNCKYGHSMLKNALRLTLIRSSYDPDILPEIGEQEIRLALVPHGETWGPSDCIRSGAAFNHPLKVVGAGVHDGDLPTTSQFLSVDAPNVILTTVKKAEAEDALILRFYEVDGKDTDVVVTLAPEMAGVFAEAVEVDLLERSDAQNTARYAGGRLSVAVPAHGITSVKLRKV
ncbi:MAG: glycoside hydrolase family 38 C-terminal domain-containing protein [Candidatus Latescibacterota bacterium]